jgi:hypothetical protein
MQHRHARLVTMDIEALNKAIVDRWFTSLWGKVCDLAIIDELASNDVILQYSPHPLRGHQAVKTFMTVFREAFPDLEFRRIGGLISDGDVVVVRWEANGTHTGPAFSDFHIGPLPASSGLSIVLSGHTAVRLRDTLIVEEAIWSTKRKVIERRIMGCLVA